MIKKNFAYFIVKEDDQIVVDLAPAPPSASQDQIDNAVQITLADYQKSNVSLEMNYSYDVQKKSIKLQYLGEKSGQFLMFFVHACLLIFD